MAQTKKPSRKSLQALDYLNFFLADVQNGVGPYLSVYLKASQHWNPAQIGVVMSVSTIATVITQTPAGALVDKLSQKRALIVVAAISVTLGCIATVTIPTFPIIIASQILVGIAAAIFPPAIAGITLGLVGRKNLDKKFSRIQSFNHAGNVIAAILAAAIGQFIDRRGIFYLVAVMALMSGIVASKIRYKEIDQQQARGDGNEEDALGEEDKKAQDENKYSNVLKLLRNRKIITFFGAIILFHFANAAMLPLVGQRLAKQHSELDPTVYMSACIIVAQLVMTPVSALCGRLVEAGRKPIFMVCFAVLPIRGVLFTLSTNPYYLVSVQILDGLANGIFGVVSVLMVADLTKGTGRFNLTQGLLSTAIGIGAGLSNLIAGFVVQKSGYNAGFLMLAAIATISAIVFWFFVPETIQKQTNTQQSQAKI